jgi:hypothetical protein
MIPPGFPDSMANGILAGAKRSAKTLGDSLARDRI